MLGPESPDPRSREGLVEILFTDARGFPVAYLEPANDTIYLLSGDAVAYVNGEHVYGFNGCHVGWYEEGILADHDGRRVGIADPALNQYPALKPLRSLQSDPPPRAIPEPPPRKPEGTPEFSPQPLDEFLRQGTQELGRPG